MKNFIACVVSILRKGLPHVRAGDTLTPQQEDRIRRLVREECYFRDREALLKLTAMTLLLKLAGTVMLGLLLLAFRFL